MLDKLLSTIAMVYVGYFLMEVVFTFLKIGNINWIELNIFGVTALYLSLRYINTIKRQSNEPIS